MRVAGVQLLKAVMINVANAGRVLTRLLSAVVTAATTSGL